MNLLLQGKRVFVSGASSGIGAAAARLFAEEGADLIAGYHQNRAGVEATARAVQAAGRAALLCPFDLAAPASIRQAVEQLPVDWRALDAVVLCAGKNVITPIAAIAPEEWDELLAVNLSGPFFLLQALAPLLRDGASVVMVASVAASTGNAAHAHYAAAKAGLVNLTKSFARALAPRVRVNCIAPGITITPMGAETVAALPDDYLQRRLLVDHYATPDEIARWIVFVASPAAAFMTGATIDVNGGRDLR